MHFSLSFRILFFFCATGQDGVHGSPAGRTGSRPCGRWRTARSAASLMMLASSAPEAPGVMRATTVKVAVGTNLDLFGVHAAGCSRGLSGRAAPRVRGGQNGRGAVRAGSRDSGRLVAARITTPLVAVEAVHLGQQLVQGLLALVVAAQAAGTVTLFADGIDLIDKHDAGRFFARPA